MKKTLLKIENLKVKANPYTKNLGVGANEKEILKGINLQIKKGEVLALLGSNGSGKSCLAQAILGNPKYKVTQGKIFFEGKEITGLFPEKRVKLGLALVWQSPPAVKGVKLSQLLEKISQCNEERPRYVGLRSSATQELLEREVNLDFSGGEKKISELLQVLSLNPKLVIFDEIDSGLDIKRAEKVAELIKKELIDKGVSILLITHWGQILNYLKPDWTQVLLDGKIICKERDFKKVLRTIKKYGYEKCKKCPLLAGRP